MRSFLLIASALAVAACSANARRGGDEGSSGEQARRNFEVGRFQSVSLEGAADVVVAVGGPASVRAESDSRAVERLEIRVENGALKIGTRRDGMFSWGHHGRATVYVTAPALDGASIGGSGDMRIDRIQTANFNGSVAGSGDMEIATLQARQAHFDLAGSGGITAAGRAEALNVSIAGSGNVMLDALEARRAAVSIAGSGDVSLRATEAVQGSILGSGDIVVHGTARCSISKLGSGDVRCGG